MQPGAALQALCLGPMHLQSPMFPCMAMLCCAGPTWCSMLPLWQLSAGARCTKSVRPGPASLHFFVLPFDLVFALRFSGLVL